MSIQSNVNKIIGGVAAAVVGKEKIKDIKAKKENNDFQQNLSQNIANKNLQQQKEYLNGSNLKSKNAIAKIKMRQALADNFRDSMATTINSKISNPNMNMKDKLELQNKLFSISDDDIISNLDNFINSKDKIKTLQDFNLKEVEDGNSK